MSRTYIFENNQQVIDSASSLSHTFNSPGIYSVKFTAKDDGGLESSASLEITVLAPPVNQAPLAQLSADTISGVAPLTVNFNSSASSDDVGIVTRNYQFSPTSTLTNGPELTSFTYETPGIYNASVTVFDQEGLSSKKSIMITVTKPVVISPPLAWFQIQADPNTGLVTLKNQAITGSSPISSVSYSINNGAVNLSSPVYAYSEAFFQAEGGLSYEIKQTVTDELGQVSEETITVVMDDALQAPTPQFNLEQSNAKQVFLNALYSFDFLNSMTSMRINWGDQTPEETLEGHFSNHTYQNAGVFSVTLTLENAQGLSSSLTREISVTDTAPEALLPVANFSAIYDDGAKYVRLFSQDSASPNGEILSYFWEYGDGQVGYGEQSVHFYSVGSHLAKLTVTDSMGLKSSQIQQIIITDSGPPIISGVDCRSFGLYGECDFFAAHKDKQLDRVDVDWGDGNIDSYPVVNNEWQLFDAIGHFYQSAGTYDVTIRAVTFLAEESISSAQITTSGDTGANQAPVANIYCFSDYLQVTCDATSSYDSDGIIVSTEIQMGDGTSYFENFANHSYGAGGTYTVRAIVTDQLGATSQTETLVNVIEKVNIPPFAELSCSPFDLNTIQCNAFTSFDSDGFIVKTDYLFDDGETISTSDINQSIFKEFSNGGEKIVSVTVYDNEGASATATTNAFIQNDNPPSADFDCNSNSILNLYCYLSYANDDSGSFQISFEFENGDVTTLPSSHIFNQNGDKTVRLTITDSRNQSSVVEKTFPILSNQAPIASLVSSALAVIAPGIIHLDSTGSSDPENQQITRLWNLPDGSSSSEIELDLPINDIGQSSVSLTVTDSYGFSDTKSLTLAGKSDFTNTINLTKSSLKIPSTLTMSPEILQDEFANPFTFEWWINGERKSTSANYSETISDPGAVEIKLVSIDSYGLRYETSVSDSLETHPLYFALNRYEGYAAQGEAVEFQIANLVLDSPDYQIDITSSDPSVVIEPVGNNAFKVTSSTVGSPIQINVVATDGIVSFERSATAEFVEMQEIFNGELGNSKTEIVVDGEKLMAISSEISANARLELGQLSDGSYLFKIPISSNVETGMNIDDFNPSFDYTINDVEVSFLNNSGTTADVLVWEYDISDFKYCLSNRVVLNDRYKTIKAQRKIEQLHTVDHFELANTGKTIYFRESLKPFIKSDSSNIAKVIDKAIKNNALESNQKIFIMSAKEIFAFAKHYDKTVVIPPDGLVFEGINTLYLNFDSFNNSGENEYEPYFILAHESHHASQYINCSSSGMRNAFYNPDSQKVLLESFADLAAMSKLLSISSLSLYDNLLDYTDFRKQGNINLDFLVNLEKGFNTSKDESYSNELYFDILGLDENSFIENSFSNDGSISLERNAYPYTFASAATSKLNKYLTALAPLGLSLPTAALDPATDGGTQPVGPYGFGYLKIPSSVINSGLLDGNKFRIKVAHEPTVSFPFLSNANNQLDKNENLLGSFSRLTNDPKKIDSKTHILEFQVRDEVNGNSYNPIDKDGYFSVVNDSFQEASFTVMATSGRNICYQDTPEKFFYENPLKKIRRCIACNSENPDHHYQEDSNSCCDTTTGVKFWYDNKCVDCDTNNPYNHFNQSTGKCDVCNTNDPKNHYYSDPQQCLSCDTTSGNFIYDPGNGSPRKCVSCSTGKLNADGTCDYPKAEITYTKTVYDPIENRPCTGTFGDGIGWLHCDIKFHCEGGYFGNYGTNISDLFTTAYESRVYCKWGSTVATYSHEGNKEITAVCKNPEGEETSLTVSCP